MWWLLAIFSGFFLYGISRRRYTVNNYVDCDGGRGDSYYNSGDNYSDDGGSDEC